MVQQFNTHAQTHKNINDVNVYDINTHTHRYVTRTCVYILQKTANIWCSTRYLLFAVLPSVVYTWIREHILCVCSNTRGVHQRNAKLNFLQLATLRVVTYVLSTITVLRHFKWIWTFFYDIIL